MSSTRIEHPGGPARRAPRLRAWWAVTCALVVAIAGLAAPAQAADGRTISGQVVLPTGTTNVAATLEVWPVGSNFSLASAPLPADGTFSVDLGDSQASGYHLRLRTSSSSLLATGWHTGTTTAVERSAAAALPAGSSGVLVRAVVGASMSGRVEYPAGYDELTSVRVETPDSASASSINQVFVTNGQFVATNLVPGGQYLVRIYSFSSNALYDGWVRADGTWGPRVGAARFSAPTTGLVLRPNRAGAISGRVVMPEGARSGAWVGAYYADGVRIESQYTGNPDEHFVIDELDTAATYRIGVTSSSETVDGFYAAGGTFVPTYAAALALRPPVADLVVRPTSVPAIRGVVELPAGYTLDRDASPRVMAQAQDEDGTWREHDRTWVDEVTGAFSLTDVEPSTPYRVYFDAATTEPGAPRSGWWTGDTTAVTTDPTRARTVSTTTVVRFPLELRATKAPTVWGSTALGGTLNASRGTWEPTPTGYRFQWLRNGTPIAGATSSRYKVVKADLGLNLSVRVTATAPDRPQGTARSATLRIPKATPKVSISVPKTATAGRAVTVTARVTTSGVSATPSGTVRISYAGGSRTVPLSYAHEGRVTVTLTGLARGTHTVRAVYTPSTLMARYVTSATSAGAALRVV